MSGRHRVALASDLLDGATSPAGLAQRALIIQRAAWLTANAPLAKSIVINRQTNLISDGPSVRSRHPDASVRGAPEDAWNNGFWNLADVEGGDLVQFLNRVTRGLVTNGETFVRLLTTRQGDLRLQLTENLADLHLKYVNNFSDRFGVSGTISAPAA